jgi:nitrite reductase/ring-hydroxylating ferredoxin subunit
VAGRFPFPIPFGWYQVAYSDELAPGQLLPLRYFGRELVALRGASGRAAVLDAHCPHLGAHLGHGGRVEGETLRCPFHGWGFDPGGACVDVPYARRIPPAARLRAWPVLERNGLLMVWHHAEGVAPLFELPELPEYGAPGWTPYHRERLRVATCNQEIIENVADRAHFHYVHHTVDVPQTIFEMDGPRLRAKQVTRLRTPRGDVDGGIESLYHGLGFGAVRFTGICEALMLIAITPVEPEQLDVRFSFTLDAASGASPERGVGKAIIADILKQFVEDIPIWENKRYRPQPLLCDGDGPIPRYRSWAAQFYAT